MDHMLQCWIFLSDCNGAQTHNHLARKRRLSYLAKLPLWLNSWVFVYKTSCCGFESTCSHLDLLILRFFLARSSFCKDVCDLIKIHCRMFSIKSWPSKNNFKTFFRNILQTFKLLSAHGVLVFVYGCLKDNYI